MTDPRGVEAALGSPNPGSEVLVGRLPQNCLLRFQAPLPSAEPFVLPKEHLSIYAEGYFERLLEIITEDFSETFNILGEEKFQELFSEYLCHYPSRSPCVADVGESLPKFIQESRWGKRQEGLVEAAHLDWAKMESFYAWATSAFDWDNFFQGLSPEDWGRVEVALNPSTRLLARKGPKYLIVHQGQVQELPFLAFRLLEALGQGMSLGELLPEQFDCSAEELSTCFSKYFSEWRGMSVVSGARLRV